MSDTLSDKRIYFKEPFVFTKEQIELDLKMGVDNSVIFTKDVREAVKEILKDIEDTIFNQKFITTEYRKMISDRVIDKVKKRLGEGLIHSPSEHNEGCTVEAPLVEVDSYIQNSEEQTEINLIPEKIVRFGYIYKNTGKQIQ